MSNILKQDIMYVNGVGPTKKQILNKELGIMTIGDMLEYYPYKWIGAASIPLARLLKTCLLFRLKAASCLSRPSRWE